MVELNFGQNKFLLIKYMIAIPQIGGSICIHVILSTNVRDVLVAYTYKADTTFVVIITKHN